MKLINQADQSSSPVLQINHVSRAFNKGQVEAVSDLNLNLSQGQILGLIGLNGAGKTTTVKMCATLLNPSAGTITVCGYDTVRHPAQARRHMGLMLGGSTGFYPRTSVKDNLLFFADIAGLPADKRQEEVSRVLAQVELSNLADKKAYELSRGQYQRLHIARSLLGSVDLLLLDEPTSGLDPDVALHIRSLIRSIAAQGRAILLTSHSMEEVEELATSFLVMSHGRMKVSGSLADVAAYAHVYQTTIADFTPDNSYDLSDLRKELAGSARMMARSAGSQWRVTIWWKDSPEMSRDRINQLTTDLCRKFHLESVFTRPANLEDAFLAIAQMPDQIEEEA